MRLQADRHQQRCWSRVAIILHRLNSATAVRTMSAAAERMGRETRMHQALSLPHQQQQHQPTIYIAGFILLFAFLLFKLNSFFLCFSCPRQKMALIFRLWFRDSWLGWRWWRHLSRVTSFTHTCTTILKYRARWPLSRSMPAVRIRRVCVCAKIKAWNSFLSFVSSFAVRCLIWLLFLLDGC